MQPRVTTWAFHFPTYAFVCARVNTVSIWNEYVYMFVSVLANMQARIPAISGSLSTQSAGEKETTHSQPPAALISTVECWLFPSQKNSYLCSEYCRLLWQTVKQQTETHPLWERPGWTDVEHLWHVLRVALLSDIAQFGRDVDPPADVHVHSPSFLLDLGVQLWHLLQG